MWKWITDPGQWPSHTGLKPARATVQENKNPHRGRHARACQAAQERLGLLRPTTADFNAKHHQTSAPWTANKLWVSPFLPTSRCGPRGFSALRRSHGLCSWAPPNRGKPSAATSSLRASAMFGSAKSRSRTMTFVTLPPASEGSEQSRSPTRTLSFTTPSPVATGIERKATGRSARLRERTTRNSCGGILVTRHVGHVDKARPAPSPPWERTSAWPESVNVWLPHVASLVCFLAQTPLVGGGLVSRRSEWQSTMVGSTPGRKDQAASWAARKHGVW